MKNLLSILVLSSLSFGASATVFEDKVDQNELANAMIKCATEAQRLGTGYTFVRSITGKHTSLSKGVDLKTITLVTAEPRGFGSSVPGPVLIISQKVTQPPVGSFDIPSRSEYSCSVK